MQFFRNVAILWAGALLGGSLIAAPAKFQVESLTRPVAIQVGRIQFLWLLYAELICLLTMIVILTTMLVRVGFHKVRTGISILLVIMAILAVQHWLLMPLLQTRSERIIQGELIDGSSLHWIYIILEVGKWLALLWIGFGRKNAVRLLS